jgi:CSLREA domain-containing protein
MRAVRSIIILLPLLLLASLISFSPVLGAQFQVTKTADTNDGLCDGDCSLREAIIAANTLGEPENLILLPSGRYFITIPGSDEDQAATGDLDITVPMNIRGQGHEDTIVNALGELFGVQDRVFHVLAPPGSWVTFEKIGIYGGYAKAVVNDSAGGGICADMSANVRLEQCHVYANSAFVGGGVYFRGSAATSQTLEIVQSVLQGNEAYGGGAVSCDSASIAIDQSSFHGNQGEFAGAVDLTGCLGEIENSTFYQNDPIALTTDNSAISLVHTTLVVANPDNSYALAIQGTPGTGGLNWIVLHNSIIWGRCSPAGEEAFDSRGGNMAGPGNTCGMGEEDIITELTPLLLPLGDYGGPTPTAPPALGSQAIDNGIYDPGFFLDHDQRGVARPQEGDGLGAPEYDIGAVERESITDILRRYFGDLKFMVRDSSIPSGIQKALTRKAAGAEFSYMRENFRASINELGALNNQVYAQRGKQLSPEVADKIGFVATQAIGALREKCVQLLPAIGVLTLQ